MFDSTAYDHTFNVFCVFCVSGLSAGRVEFFLFRRATFEAADSAHCSEHCGLHFDVPHSSLVRFPQIFQFFFVREGTESPIQSTLTCKAVVTSRPASVTKTQAWHARGSRTFIEVMGAHGVSNHCGENIEL